MSGSENQRQQKEHARSMALKNGEGHGFMEDARDAFNTRSDEKNGQYYVKGKAAHKESELFGGRNLESDPNL